MSGYIYDTLYSLFKWKNNITLDNYKYTVQNIHVTWPRRFRQAVNAILCSQMIAESNESSSSDDMRLSLFYFTASVSKVKYNLQEVLRKRCIYKIYYMCVCSHS